MKKRKYEVFSFRASGGAEQSEAIVPSGELRIFFDLVNKNSKFYHVWMKESITQEDDMGCGVACVAFVAGQTYKEAVKILGQSKARTTGYHLRELISGLESFGLAGNFMYIKSGTKPATYEKAAIVFIERSARYPYGHYLAHDNGIWMDPWINLPQDKSIRNARSGYRKRLPGRPQYAIFLD